MRRHMNRRMLVLGGVAIIYMLVLIFYGSPLLAFSTWMGWVDPEAVR
jgi:hypothetical protein